MGQFWARIYKLEIPLNLMAINEEKISGKTIIAGIIIII
jgi:hypothetical protein